MYSPQRSITSNIDVHAILSSAEKNASASFFFFSITNIMFETFSEWVHPDMYGSLDNEHIGIFESLPGIDSQSLGRPK